MKLTIGYNEINTNEYINKYITFTFPAELVKMANIYKGDNVSVSVDGDLVTLKISEDGCPLVGLNSGALKINVNEKNFQWKLNKGSAETVDFQVIDDSIILEVPSKFFQKERGFKLLSMRGFSALQKAV